MNDPKGRPARAWPAAVLAALLVTGAGPAAASAGVPPGLDLTGEPLVHVFDLGRPGDGVSGEWRVAATSGATVSYDGVLTAVEHTRADLARALVVEYGRVSPDGTVRSWHPAGTLAEPRSYGDALAVDPTLGPAEVTRIPVRVSLPEPGTVDADRDEELLVRATFTVGYLEDADASPQPAPSPGPLAVTGAGAGAAALAVVLLALGHLMVRRARS